MMWVYIVEKCKHNLCSFLYRYILQVHSSDVGLHLEKCKHNLCSFLYSYILQVHSSDVGLHRGEV